MYIKSWLKREREREREKEREIWASLDYIKQRYFNEKRLLDSQRLVDKNQTENATQLQTFLTEKEDLSETGTKSRRKQQLGKDF